MSSSPSKLYVILIICVGLVGGFVAYNQWVKPAENVIPPPALSSQDSLTSFESLKIDFSVLKNAVSSDLVVSGESPVNPGVTGKKDIFAP